MKSTIEAYNLLHEGSLVLADMEENGIRIDVDYLNKAIQETQEKIDEIERKLKESDVYQVWKRIYGINTNFDSRAQLGRVLFNEMKIAVPDKTEKGNYRTDISSLEKLNLPFIKDRLRIEKLKKTKNTFLKGIKQELVGEYIHTIFNLHTARSFRSSCNDPNFQNFPVRDKEQGETIRRCFIPRKGRRLVDIDLVGAEVRIAACYHKDPKMLEYIKDPSKDMHRDSAARVYKLKKSQVTKDTRYCAKNMFVFPQFYGSVYFQCAPALWEAIDLMKLTTPEGVGLKEHLANKGIKELGRCDPQSSPISGTFEHHVAEVEKKFWNEDFQGYSEWKKQWYQEYKDRGGFRLLTGFWIEGLYKRNEVLNLPIQGTAFHIILLFLIKMNKWLKKNKMKTLLFGEIHDSCEADCPDNELQDYLGKAKEVITVEIPKEWPWIIVPLDIEVEVAPVDGSWHKKEQWIEDNGIWRKND